MAFLIRCPACGPRDSSEFRYGGECSERPDALDDDRVWADWVFGRDNRAGPQREWWFHRWGCRKWFVAVRDLNSNVVGQTAWFTPVTPDTKEPRE